jgi:hypothetical protein
VRADQGAARPISEPQCLHLVAAGFRSSDRHAGQVLVGGGSHKHNLALSGHNGLVGQDDYEIDDSDEDNEVDDRRDEASKVEEGAVAAALDELPHQPRAEIAARNLSAALCSGSKGRHMLIRLPKKTSAARGSSSRNLPSQFAGTIQRAITVEWRPYHSPDQRQLY